MHNIEIASEVRAAFIHVGIRNYLDNKWVTFKIVDEKRVEVDQKGDPCRTETRDDDKAKFKELKDTLLKANEPRYAIYGFRFNGKDGNLRETPALILW